jgi:hypothetical protein
LQSTPCRVGQYNGFVPPMWRKTTKCRTSTPHSLHQAIPWHQGITLKISHSLLGSQFMPCSQGITGHFHYGVKVPIETKWKSYANISIWGKMKVESWSWLCEVSTSCIFLMLFKVLKWNDIRRNTNPRKPIKFAPYDSVHAKVAPWDPPLLTFKSFIWVLGDHARSLPWTFLLDDLEWRFSLISPPKMGGGNKIASQCLCWGW